MIARLTGQIAHAKPVFDDQHAVAVQTANHRTRRSGAGAANRNAGLVLDRRSQGALERLRQLLPAEHVGCLERFELAAALRTDRRHLAEMKLGIELDIRGLLSPLDLELGTR